MTNLNRELSSLEKTFHGMNENQPFTIIMCAHIKGELSYEILEQALEIMKERHYYLSYSIQETKNGLEWIYEENAKIPIEVIETTNDDKWIEICNLEMNISIIHSEASLAKVVFLKKTDGADLIFKISHIISDGISVYHFIRELFIVIDGLYKKIKITFPYPLSDIYPDIKYFPTELKELNEVEILKLPISLLEKYPYFQREERFTQIIPYQFNIDQSKAIMERCKEKKITVNSLLAAAMIISIKNHIFKAFGNTEEFTIKSSSGLNLRSYFQTDVKPEQLGCWSGFGYVFFNSKEIKSLWDCAGIFQARLKDFFDQQKPFIHWKKFIEIYKHNSVQEKSQKIESEIPYVILTNLGKWDLDEWYGDKIQLEKISVITPMHRHWGNDFGFGIVAHTFNKCLNLAFHYTKPARTLEQAKDFANQILNLVLEDNGTTKLI